MSEIQTLIDEYNKPSFSKRIRHELQQNKSQLAAYVSRESDVSDKDGAITFVPKKGQVGYNIITDPYAKTNIEKVKIEKRGFDWRSIETQPVLVPSITKLKTGTDPSSAVYQDMVSSALRAKDDTVFSGLIGKSLVQTISEDGTILVQAEERDLPISQWYGFDFTDSAYTNPYESFLDVFIKIRARMARTFALGQNALTGGGEKMNVALDSVVLSLLYGSERFSNADFNPRYGMYPTDGTLAKESFGCRWLEYQGPSETAVKKLKLSNLTQTEMHFNKDFGLIAGNDRVATSSSDTFTIDAGALIIPIFATSCVFDCEPQGFSVYAGPDIERRNQPLIGSTLSYGCRRYEDKGVVLLVVKL